MGLYFGQLALYSKNVNELAAFLSELLEAELRPAENAVRLIHGHFTMIIFEEPRSGATNNNMMVDFFLESKEELEELHQKAQFFTYRLRPTESQQSIENIVSNIKNLNVISYFFVTDTDGRKWKFSYREA